MQEGREKSGEVGGGGEGRQLKFSVKSHEGSRFIPPHPQAGTFCGGRSDCLQGEKRQEILSCIVLPALNNAAGILCVRPPSVNVVGDLMLSGIEFLFVFQLELQIRSLE